MKARKLVLPLLVALACIGLGIATAAAATDKPANPAHATPKALRIDSIEVGTKAGPLVVRVGAGIGSQLKMTVNGRPVRHSFEPDGKHVQLIELRSTDGLRAGPNRLTVTATRAGVARTAARRISVPGWALLADAGEDTTSITHLRTRVGTAPPPGADGSGGNVRYSWRVVQRPPGAKATLVGRGKAQPVLHAKKPGTYVLQLEANPEEGGEPTSFDQVTVSVVDEESPVGMALNTIDPVEHGIRIGGRTYANDNRNGSAAFLVLERTTLAVADAGTILNDDAGVAKLNEVADQFSSGSNYMRYMMIVSGRFGMPKAQLDGFAALLKKLGGALPTPKDFEDLGLEYPYSVIGIPGASAGTATTRFAAANKDPASGAITGVLGKNNAVDANGTPLYEYISTETPSFDTKAPGSNATKNTMTVNGQSYTAALPSGAGAGLHLVVLDSLSLAPLANVALATNGGGNDRKLQEEAAKKLGAETNKPGGPLVLLQTIGMPKAAGPEWEGIVNQLTRLGANPQLVNALDGTTEYAFVGRENSEAPPAEASTAHAPVPYQHPEYPYPPAHLIGTLARSRTSNFVPNVFGTPTANDPTGGVNIALTQLAYQAPQAWPALAQTGTADEAATAQKFICAELNFCQAVNSCPSLRQCFWQSYGSEWSMKYAELGHVEFPGGGKGFNAQVFDEVKKELLKETAAVANVKAWLRRLGESFDKSALRSYVDLQNIGQNIWASLQQPAPDNSTSWALGAIGKMIALGGFAGPPVSAASSGLAASFGLASYLSNKQGQPILGTEIKAQSTALGDKLLERIELARATTVGLGKLLVSDYGKLTTANKNLDSAWKLPPEGDLATSAVVRNAARQWFYEALIPTAYPYLIRGNNTDNARNLDCQMRNRRAWPNQPDAFQMQATIGYDTSGKPINGVFFFTRGIGGGSSPPASLGDQMFRPRSENDGLGMEKLEFFTARVFGGKIAYAINSTPSCSAGWLPPKY